jgi:hypothetical protein
LIALSRYELDYNNITSEFGELRYKKKNHKKKDKHKRHGDFSNGSAKRQMLAYTMLWCPNGQGLHSTPLK